MQIPVLSVDLIKALDKEFPLQNPSNDVIDRAIWRRAGRRDVVEMLLSSLKTNFEDQMKK